MIRFRQKGDFRKLNGYLEKSKEVIKLGSLDKYGEEGVAALASATPSGSGLTAASWNYDIVRRGDSVSIEFYNSNIQNGVNIAIVLQYGHATNNGGYVKGIDYINPALNPLFKKIADEAWKEVIKRE